MKLYTLPEIGRIVERSHTYEEIKTVWDWVWEHRKQYSLVDYEFMYDMIAHKCFATGIFKKQEITK